MTIIVVINSIVFTALMMIVVVINSMVFTALMIDGDCCSD
jgi:hypothetical protein